MVTNSGTAFIGGWDRKLYAYDTNGVTNCSGTPKVCTPLWHYTTQAAVESSPTIANGIVYTGSDDHFVYAFKLP